MKSTDDDTLSVKKIDEKVKECYIVIKRVCTSVERYRVHYPVSRTHSSADFAFDILDEDIAMAVEERRRSEKRAVRASIAKKARELLDREDA